VLISERIERTTENFMTNKRSVREDASADALPGSNVPMPIAHNDTEMWNKEFDSLPQEEQ